MPPLMFSPQDAVSKKILLGRISSVSSDPTAFPSISVEFAALYAPSSSDEDWRQSLDADFDVNSLEKEAISVIDLMIEQCHAKRREFV